MDLQPKDEQPVLLPIKVKVVLAFLFACIAILLAVTTTYYSFHGLLDKVDELAAPNEKLKILNQLFEQVSQLDQQQRADAIKNPQKSHRAFLIENKSLVNTIDTLLQLCRDDSAQVYRLKEMKVILTKRDYLLVQYLRLRSSVISNKKYSHQIDSLSEILVNSKPSSDSSVRTTQKKITTTTYEAPPAPSKKQSFMAKLFSKKKKTTATQSEPEKNKIEVKEEVNITVDTLAVAKQDSAISKVGRIMKALEKGQQQQSHKVLERELALVKANIALIDELLIILRQTEKEVIASAEIKDNEAAQMVNQSIRKIGIIITVFFLIAALLVFLILIDISKSNFYRKQLIEAKEQTEELSKIKQRFFANMSHEIRTPLQSIIGFLELLKKNKNSPDSYRDEAINAIKSSSEHLLHIVNELLDFSRIESETFSLQAKPFDLAHLIDEVSTVMRVQAEKKNLEFILGKIHFEKLNLIGDDFRLRQMLYNVIGNAIKFTQHGSIKFETEIAVDKKIKCVFKITDTGVGIAQKDLQTIFARYEQGDTYVYKQHEGVGLGLSIVKKLVDLQAGTIDVESEVDKGTIFILHLDFEKAEDEAIISENQTLHHKPQPFQGKVIVVDDDPMILRLCELNFQNHSIAYKTFQQSEKVLKEDLSDVRFIFLDIRMPVINGIELCKLLRPKTNAKIIALTAQVLPQEKSSLLEIGFDDVLAKPFRQADFLQLLGIIDIKNDPDSYREKKNDLSSLKKMTMGDEQLYQSIIAQFIDETQNDISPFEKNLERKDKKELRELTHKLAGRTAQIGLTKIAETFRHIEIQLVNGNDADKVFEEFNQTLILLREALHELQKEVVEVVK